MLRVSDQILHKFWYVGPGKNSDSRKLWPSIASSLPPTVWCMGLVSIPLRGSFNWSIRHSLRGGAQAVPPFPGYHAAWRKHWSWACDTYLATSDKAINVLCKAPVSCKNWTSVWPSNGSFYTIFSVNSIGETFSSFKQCQNVASVVAYALLRRKCHIWSPCHKNSRKWSF